MWEVSALTGRNGIHAFDAVACVLFAVNIGEYDMSLYEDPNASRLTESISLFRDVANNDLFIDTTKILIFNKVEVFL